MSADEEPKLYSSTAGTYFTDKESLAEHYRSELHQYNLRRKVAGLPPVTREWFDARKDQLQGTAAAAPQKTWFDPLTKKRFGSENTYLAHINSKKYKELVSKSGVPAPEPVVQLKRSTPAATPKQSMQPASPSGFGTSIPNGVVPEAEQSGKERMQAAENPAQPGGNGYESEEDGEDEDEDEGSEWETASEDDVDAAAVLASSSGKQGTAQTSSSSQASTATGIASASVEEGAEAESQWEPWDVRRSLFDNHISPSTEANLEYMWKKYGFYIPDSQFLVDPEGLIKYLGAKMQYGGVPLYVRGEDDKAKQFRSLHSVQRHMIDSNQCKMAYDDNEEEYEDYYDYDAATSAEAASTSGGELMLGGADEPAEAVNYGYELSIPADETSGAKGKVLGSREFARFYKQRPRLDDTRHSVAVNKVLARYRSLGVALLESSGASREEKQSRTVQKKFDRLRLRNDMKSNVIRNLPQNVPY
ncbi:hypothetical protein WJX84_004997 [Apatococcus fuscideae]|uniref:ZN622/Rei1/Reh1 zinc finger C2H2-type domain-containing protein n=1 Tax=Apatococcus fuscideae TaxID=2026836 RepID=A0AAW1TG87_9CHLO